MKALWFATLFGLTLNWPFGAAADLTITQPETAQQHVEQLRASLLQTLKLIEERRVDGAAIAAALKPILTDPSFALLKEADRHVVYLIQGGTLSRLGDFAGAAPLLQQASEMPEARGVDWDFRLRNSCSLNDWKDAAQSATVLAQKWPERLARFDDQLVFEIVSELDQVPDSAPTEIEMLKAFRAIQWHPIDPFLTADPLWLPLIRLDLGQNKVADAVAMAADLRDPVSIVGLRVDKRFDPIIEGNPGGFDVVSAYQASLADLRAKSAAAPNKLEGPNIVADRLLTLDRPEEALETVTTALARYNANPSAFADAEYQLNWTHETRSLALFALGKSDEALADLAEGANEHERGRENVSQRIDLAGEYVAYDRPKDALSALEGMEALRASAYGAMALADARACAYFELGDTDALKRTLAYMQPHANDGAEPYMHTLLAIGEQDAAAAQLIAALRDPAQRLETLRWVQNYLPQRHSSAREQSVHAAWIAVRNRPDVQAEIAKVGHIGSYPLQGSSF